MSKLLFKELTGEIIGAYYEVYNHTSRTYPERVYEHCLMYELRRRRIPCVCQDELRIEYKGKIVGLHRLDLLVDGRVVVENKVAERIAPLHKAQTISYLKAWEKNVGLVFNFIGGVVAIVVITGALKMKRLQSYPFAMIASIIAMIPCISPCCLLGLPFGIWALVVLSDPQVKAAFRG